MNKNLTEIAYILDQSGSMQCLKEAAISGFNTFLNEQQDTSGEATFSLILFDSKYRLHTNRKPIHEVEPLSSRTYIPQSGTALLDAIGHTIQRIGKKLADTPEHDRPGKVIIAIYTDGYENSSTEYTSKEIRKMIQHQTNKYGWEFLFLAANENAMETAASYGIKRQNASCVSNNSAGMLTSTLSFSRKIKAVRATLQGNATMQERLDARKALGKIISEEERKH